MPLLFRQQNIVLVTALVLLVLLWTRSIEVHHQPNSVSFNRSPALQTASVWADVLKLPSDTTSVDDHRLPEKNITLIAYWSGSTIPPANYLPAFFESVRRQAGNVQLLWVNTYPGTGRTGPPSCLDLEAVGGNLSNVQGLCMPRHELYTRFRDVLCKETDGWWCSEEERQQTLKHIIKVGEGSALVNFKV